MLHADSLSRLATAALALGLLAGSLALPPVPEAVAGPKSLASAARRPFYMAADEWNVLHRKLGKKNAKGSAADEYVTTTALVLRELRELADSGGNVKGRFLLSGFDRLADLDSATELHRQTKALVTSHQGGDAGAADRVKDLGWGSGGAPADVAKAQADLDGYRASVAAFKAEVAAAGAAPAVAAPLAGALDTAAPTDAQPAAGLSGAPIDQAINDEVSQMESPLPAGGLHGWHVFRQGLTDVTAAARNSHGGRLVPATGGLTLPPGTLSFMEKRLKDPALPEDSTAKRFGRILAAFTPDAKARLDRAIAAGKLRDAQKIYQAITGEADAYVKSRVQSLRARRQSGDQVRRTLARAPAAADLAKKIPPGPEEIPTDEDYLKAAPNPGEFAAAAAALPAVAAYLPPPPRRDGEPYGDEALTRVHAGALAGAQQAAAAAAAGIEVKAKAAQAGADAHAASQREGHLDSIREAGFGPIPGSCPAGEEVSLCPEKHILKTHPGRCRPVGLGCDVAGVVDLAFP